MPRKGGWCLTQWNSSLRECRTALVISTMLLTADSTPSWEMPFRTWWGRHDAPGPIVLSNLGANVRRPASPQGRCEDHGARDHVDRRDCRAGVVRLRPADRPWPDTRHRPYGAVDHNGETVTHHYAPPGGGADTR